VEALTIPAVVLTFLLHLGCTPVQEAYLVDEIVHPVDPTAVVDGAYCYRVEEPYCPKERAVFIVKGSHDSTSTLVHELWHSCQEQASFKSPEWMRNEAEARAIESYWKMHRARKYTW